MAQGFVHQDLSRACFAQTTDALPRVVLIGRLALYGPEAARLHEGLIPVTVRWLDLATRTSHIHVRISRPNLSGAPTSDLGEFMKKNYQKDVYLCCLLLNILCNSGSWLHRSQRSGIGFSRPDSVAGGCRSRIDLLQKAAGGGSGWLVAVSV